MFSAFERFIGRVVLALLLAVSCAGEVEKIRGVIDSTLLPLPQAASDRESEWNVLQTLIDATPALSVSSPLPAAPAPDYRGFPAWQETSNRLLRELGAEFFERYPEDPRCWIWLEATLARNPQYLHLPSLWRSLGESGIQPETDPAARDRWRDLYPTLRAACLADLRAPLHLRVRLRIQEVNAPEQRFLRAAIRQERVDFVEEIDWPAWAQRLAELGREFPTAPEDLIAAAAQTFLRRARRYAPEEARQAERLLADNPHVALRALAAGGAALDAARRTPMEMSFTAVDGREVDLRALRGQVVLIVFWAATWCSACKEQEPLLKQVYADYSQRGFAVLGIACEMKPEDRQRLLDYVHHEQIPWPQFFEGNGMKNRYARQFGFDAIPQYLLLDTNGLLVAHSQSSGGLRNLEAVVRRLLRLPPLRVGDEQRELGGPSEKRSASDVLSNP